MLTFSLSHPLWIASCADFSEFLGGILVMIQLRWCGFIQSVYIEMELPITQQLSIDDGDSTNTSWCFKTMLKWIQTWNSGLTLIRGPPKTSQLAYTSVRGTIRILMGIVRQNRRSPPHLYQLVRIKPDTARASCLTNHANHTFVNDVYANMQLWPGTTYKAHESASHRLNGVTFFRSVIIIKNPI